ncbi:MAG: hypothetical protein L6R40_001528 [Gallowayella cf. fulva]|nr:MAG: hypothetical protein L6R40_001528 [Xanthomendoza cf. fulva]
MERPYRRPKQKCTKAELFRWLKWDISNQKKLDTYANLRQSAQEAWKTVYGSAILDPSISRCERRRLMGRKTISDTAAARQALLASVSEPELLLLEKSKLLMLHVLHRSWFDFSENRGGTGKVTSAKKLSPVVVKVEEGVDHVAPKFVVPDMLKTDIPDRKDSLPSIREMGILLVPSTTDSLPLTPVKALTPVKTLPNYLPLTPLAGKFTSCIISRLEEHRNKTPAKPSSKSPGTDVKYDNDLSTCLPRKREVYFPSVGVQAIGIE